jgi:hypothetical protein
MRVDNADVVPLLQQKIRSCHARDAGANNSDVSHRSAPSRHKLLALRPEKRSWGYRRTLKNLTGLVGTSNKTILIGCNPLSDGLEPYAGLFLKRE